MVQLLSEVITTGGAGNVNVGQPGQAPGVVVMVLVGENVVGIASQSHLVSTVIEVV